MAAHPLWNAPNLLSLSRLPLAVALFACIVTSRICGRQERLLPRKRWRLDIEALPLRTWR